MAKAKITHPALASWAALNAALRGCDEKLAAKLLSHERDGRRRQQFLKRIHSRLNKVRADRERSELTS